MHYSLILWLLNGTSKKENDFILQKYKSFGLVEIIVKSTKNTKGSYDTNATAYYKCSINIVARSFHKWYFSFHSASLTRGLL